MKTFLFLFVIFFSIQAYSQEFSNEVLFRIDSNDYYLVNFLNTYNKSEGNMPINDYLDLYINYNLKVKEALDLDFHTSYSFYKEYSKYQKEFSEKKTGIELRAILEEYFKGILMFNITDSMVWSRYLNDTIGLFDFYVLNRIKYNEEYEDGNDILSRKSQGSKQIIAGYQDFLKEQWIIELKRKHNIQINEKIVIKLSKHYKKYKNDPPDIAFIEECSSYLDSLEYIIIEKHAEELLFDAIKQDNHYKALDIVQFVENVDYENKNGYSLLYLTAQIGNIEMCTVLLDKGANVNILTEDESTAIMIASQNEHFDIVKLLLGRGANLNFQNNNGRTALMIASYKGYSDMVKLLLEKGANTDFQTKYSRETALHYASMEGHQAIIKMLLENGADADIQNEDGETALYLALSTGDLDITKLLISQGANLDLQTDKGSSALMIACEARYVDIVKLLIDKGASLNLQLEKRDIADLNINSSFFLSETVIVSEILAKGVDDRLVIPGISTSNASPSYATIVSNNMAEMEFPIDRIPISNGRSDMYGNQSIHRFKGEIELPYDNFPTIVGKGNKENRLTFVLLKDIGYVYVRGIGTVIYPDGRKVELGIFFDKGSTALIIASQMGYTEIVKLLLDNGANPNIKTKEGKSAYDYARNEEIEALFSE